LASARANHAAKKASVGLKSMSFIGLFRPPAPPISPGAGTAGPAAEVGMRQRHDGRFRGPRPTAHARQMRPQRVGYDAADRDPAGRRDLGCLPLEFRDHAP